jgi:non-ribosomal peptide synthase protein (TIGR01720 family)
MLGGDSIVTIQVISRLAREGYKVEMRDIFSHSTLAELSPHMMPVNRIPPQETVSGAVPLTPIQHFFFEVCHIDTHYFNQAVMLYSGKGVRFQPETLQAVILKLQEHHDALRMTFKREKQGWVQTNQGPDYPCELEVFDFRGQSGEKARQAREDKIEEIQASFRLDKGPLMKWTIFRHDEGDYLLITSHHLVIDTVSWRILFEDIEELYKQHQKGQPLQLPLKSDSYKTWSERLAEYAVSPALLQEKAYWAALESSGPGESPPFPRDFPYEGNYVKDAHTLSFCLNREHTELLLTRAHEAFGTEMNDLLLTALGLSVRQLLGNQKVAVTLEGHGREEIFEDIDINRTVGWFTSIYPVVLDMSYENHLPRQIKEIKECLRRVPHKGIGRGILRYLTPGEHTDSIDFKWCPQIGFNYLGQFDTNIRQLSFQLVQEPIKSTQSKEGRRLYELEIGGITAGKRLTMTVTFSRKQYKLETMENFMNCYKRNLEQVIMVCADRQDKELTPSDLTYKNLSIDQIDQIGNLFQ